MIPIKSIRSYFEKEVKTIKQTIKKEKMVRDSSTSAMQSWSDTTRSQAESLVAALETKLQELEKSVSNIPKEREIKKTGIVSNWNMVEIKNQEEKMNIITVPEGLGGRTIDGINLISEKTLLGSKILGKRQGQEIKINDKTFRVEKIY